jgi:ABC-type multidrug transport system fused ATPase/permease subunit
VPRIEFKNVTFRYANAKENALEGVNFVLEPGQTLGVVGGNGAGKTTLVKLLVGAYEPTSGVILVNGQPMAQIDHDSYLAQIGALFQEYPRYEFATLGENVWFGDTSKTYNREEIEKALKLADLEGFSGKFPKGLDQILSKDFDEMETTDLSGGQWQRLAIARVLYRAPNILLLDEPTSAIDAKSEQKIFQNIMRAEQGKSTLIISHRFSAVRKAEQIIVLDHGKVVELGSHKELIAKKGVYKELFEAQAEGYK